ncbi:MAG: ribosome recycling factor [Phascolarctobacterium sp.]|nr:ribosome recycling factor [Candidatus Phascolarctobacterium caballi]
MAIADVLKTLDDKMAKSVEALKTDLGSIRAGRANPAILNKVMVDYYGTPTPLNQVADISAPEPRLITVQPWEKTMVKAVEKAIMTSDLGLTPNSDGVVIRLNVPQLTEERRKDLVKQVGKKAEEYRVTLRNMRRDANDAVKKMEKAKEITEDESKKAVDDIQKATDKKMKDLETIVANKEKEVMEV